MNRFYLASSLTLALACVPFAFAQGSAKKAIERKSAGFVRAFKAKDITWFENNCTPNYSVSRMGKTYTRAQALAQMKQLFSFCKSVDVLTEKISDLKMEGKNVVVTSSVHFIGTLATQGPKPSKIEQTAVEKETWVPVGSDYKLKSQTSVSDSLKINGKPFKAGM